MRLTDGTSNTRVPGVVAVMLVSAVLILGLEAGVHGAVFQGASESELLKTADEFFREVARLRGLEIKGTVKKGVKTKAEIAQYLNERVKDEYDERELEREGKVLRKLGLIPAEMNYKEFTLKFLTEQVGGYYDPDKKTLFISAWLPLEQQKTVMVHELTHALQDQHFNLNRFIKQVRKIENDDMVLARQALVEGEGMAVMFDFVLEPEGRNFAQLPNIVSLMRSQFSAMDSQLEVFKQAPEYLRETLLFPYGYGLAFLQRIRSKKPWSAVDRIYSDLPESTEQIIHPEKYFDERDRPQAVEVRDPARLLGKRWRTTYRNVLGEFSTYLLLRLFLSEEESLKCSEGWGGDRILLVEETGGKGSVVLIESVWDTAQDADEYFKASEVWISRRFPGAVKAGDPPIGYAWAGNGERHLLQRRASRVRLILGLPERDAAKFKIF